MGHCLQKQHLLLFFCIIYRAVYSTSGLTDWLRSDGVSRDPFLPPLLSTLNGTRKALPLHELDRIKSAYSVQVYLSLAVGPSAKFGRASKSRLERVLSDVVRVDSKDVAISQIEKFPSCKPRKENQGWRQRKRMKERSAGNKVDRQLLHSHRNLLIEIESGLRDFVSADLGSEQLCKHDSKVAGVGGKIFGGKMKLNVTITIQTDDPEMVVDRLIAAKQTGVLGRQLTDAKLKVDSEEVQVNVKATFHSAQQPRMGRQPRLVLASIIVSRMSVSSFTTRAVETLKLFLADATSVPLDAIRVMNVQRWMSVSDMATVEVNRGDLNITIAFGTSNPKQVLNVLLGLRGPDKQQLQTAGLDGVMISSAVLVPLLSSMDTEPSTPLEGEDFNSGACPLGVPNSRKLGVLEGLQCDFCVCVSDPHGPNCAEMADNICLAKTPHSSCTTVLSGFLSNNLEDVGRAATAIRDRCPGLQNESVNLCACLGGSDSKECNAAWTQKCSKEPSFCLDKVQGLEGNTTAHMRYINSIAKICGEEEKLVVVSMTVSGRSSDSIEHSLREQFRAQLAKLLEMDVGSVTLLGFESIPLAAEPPGFENLDRLNITFAIYSDEPSTISAALAEAERNDVVSTVLGDAALQADQTSTVTEAVIINERASHKPQGSIAWWQIAIVVTGGFSIFVLPCCAVYLNRMRIKKFSNLSVVPSHSPPLGCLEPKEDSSTSQNIKKVPPGKPPEEDGKIQSFLPGMGTVDPGELKLPIAGRPAMQIDTFSNRPEDKPQWRTIQKSPTPIRDFSTDSESGGFLSDSFSDIDPDHATPGPERRTPQGQGLRCDDDIFFTATNQSIEVDGGGAKRSHSQSSFEGQRSWKSSGTSLSDYTSADGEGGLNLAVAVHHEELATSVNLPPSPYSHPETPPNATRTQATKMFRGAPSLFDSSDLDYDLRSPEAPNISQFQYRAYDPEPHNLAYNRQYVNYLYDAPCSSGRMSTTSEAPTSPDTLNQNNRYRKVSQPGASVIAQ